MGNDHQAGGDQAELSSAEWVCNVCGWVYDERVGRPEDGIPAGTRWEDIPEDWLCPDCGVGKHDFTRME